MPLTRFNRLNDDIISQFYHYQQLFIWDILRERYRRISISFHLFLICSFCVELILLGVCPRDELKTVGPV